MKKIAIVTDSTADLPIELAAKNNISVIPLKVFFGNEEYLDGVNLTKEDFLKKIKTSPVMPNTSQPSPGEFQQFYERLAQQGFENIISIHISSKLSGTVNSAIIAKSLIKNTDIRVIDSHTASVGLGLVTLRAATLLESLADPDELEKQIESELKMSKIFFTVKTLEYLSKNGRIGRAQAFLGKMLDLKPILALEGGQGEIIPVNKIKGSYSAIDEIIQLVIKHYKKTKYLQGIGIAHSNMEHEMKYMAKILSEKLGDVYILTGSIGSVIGSHVGPEVIGAAIF
jgi:DegV family protein with EDD domain